MALLRPLLLLWTTLVINPMNVKSKTNQQTTVPLGSSLSPNATPWLSPSGLFAFGFVAATAGGNDSFTVGVFMLGQPETTVVWTANRDDPPVRSSAVVELTLQGSLVLRMSGEKLVASTTSQASSGSMLDSGNFVLYDNESRVIWESFGSPTDTILGGQNLTSGSNLISSKSDSDRSSGRFLLGNQGDGNLVMYPVNSSYFPQESYWASGFTGDKPNLYLNHTGFLYYRGDSQLGGSSMRILANGSSDENGQNNKTGTIIYRATFDPDGVLRVYSHQVLGNKSLRADIKWSIPEDRCDVKGLCGFNSFCETVEGEGATCRCFPGFEFIEPESRFLGCYQNFVEDNCREESGSGMARYNISTPLENVTWVNIPYSVLPLGKEICSKSCLDDCNCWAISYTSDRCRKYKLPLRFARRSDKSGTTTATTAFFKAVLGGFDTRNHGPPPQINPQALVKSKNAPILILDLSLGSVALLCFVTAVTSVVVHERRASRYKKLSDSNIGLAEYFTLQSFSYDELEKATNGFREELGRGCFGAVYKGTLSGGSKTVAVKRLEKVVEEGIREFRAEITTIGRTHHKNLVQLVGFCVEGSKKLLVYEFMSNGSLADLLFKSSARPYWRDRVRFVLDVAKGVLYLHEECGIHIIHCNLKPHNVLLDDNRTAKISDFGLARLLMPNHAEMSVGYVAPEWKKNAMISVKADVYSFGIVLLETLCCRRNIEVTASTPADEIVLSDWAYRCYAAGELNKLVEEEFNMKTLERMVKVGLWCVQEDPASRPVMKNVILMLEGTMDIPVPPSPQHSLASSSS